MKIEEIKQCISYLHATKQSNLADIVVKEKVLKGVDSMHNLLTELYESILELMDNEMSGMDYRALRDEAEKYLQDTKEKS